jgi:hypothetical protein
MGGRAMTKYVNYYQKPLKTEKEKMEPHPVWRGIGLILAVVIPTISYLLVNNLLQNPGSYPWLGIPPQLVIPVLWDPLILIRVLYTLLVTVVIFVVIGLVTLLLYKLAGVKALKD